MFGRLKNAIAGRQAFAVAETAGGERYCFGEALNEALLSTAAGRRSVFALVAEAAPALGARDLPDVAEIAGHAARTVGHDNFGVPRLPEGHRPRLPARTLLRALWPAADALLRRHRVEPLHYGWAIGRAAQRCMVQAREAVEPGLAARILMEAAVPMAKVDPATVPAG